jgi:hypothetical protein
MQSFCKLARQPDSCYYRFCFCSFRQLTDTATHIYISTKQNVLHFVDRASRYNSLLMTNLTHFLYLYLLHLSTCFEHHSAHHREIEFVSVCGNNFNVVSMCAMSPVGHTSNISSCQKKKLFQFSCVCEKIPLRLVLWFSCYKCL